MKFHELSRIERYAAQKLAEDFLQIVPANLAPKFINIGDSFTDFMRPENVCAVMANDDEAAVVFRDDRGFVQVSKTCNWAASRRAFLVRVIAMAEAAAKPIEKETVDQYSERRIVKFLVHNGGHELRTIAFRNDRIPELARQFADPLGSLRTDELTYAKWVVLKKERHPGNYVMRAAAFLFANGISTLDTAHPLTDYLQFLFNWCSVERYEPDDVSRNEAFISHDPAQLSLFQEQAIKV